jgi:potassium channel subfamily K
LITSVVTPVLAVCAFAGVTHFTFTYGLGQDWTLIDSLYFASSTVTTVGFGDVAPNDDTSRALCVIYLLVGVGIVAGALFTIVSWFTDRRDQWVVYMMLLNANQEKVQAGEDIEPNFKLKRAIAKATAQVVVAIAVGALTGLMEPGWGLADSIYASATMVTTVGYGDVSPTTQVGRAYMAIFMPFGMAVMVAALAEVSVVSRMKGRNYKLADILSHLTKENEKLGKLGGKHAEVTLPAFQLFMIKRMGKVDQILLDEIERYFKAFDTDGNGVLDVNDLLPPNKRAPVRSASESDATFNKDGTLQKGQRLVV